MSKISVVIPHVPKTKELDESLDRCVKSLKGYDELILVINDGIGFGKSFNRGFKYSKGDFIYAISNDTELIEGNLADLVDPDAVTAPMVNGRVQPFWGCFFVMPRWVYEKTGGFDEDFGLAYYEDNDFILRLKKFGIPMKAVPSVKISHEGGKTVKALGKEQEAAAFGKEVFEKKHGTIS
jgi:GT2 family glycosyltransferase